MNASNINCILYNTTSQKFGIIKNYYYCKKKYIYIPVMEKLSFLQPLLQTHDRSEIILSSFRNITKLYIIPNF